LRRRLEELWYSNHPLRLLLLPLSVMFALGVRLRRFAFNIGLFSVHRLPVPVIVVGNISVGGTGKTPLVSWLARFLRDNGYRPGVVSRGYGGNARSWPQQVRDDSDAFMVGDEPVVIARHTGVPVAVGPDRIAAARALLQFQQSDVIISDDGLQHYRMHRDIEIAVIDGVRRHGNGLCLPSGPLREPVSRLRQVDLIVTNGIAARGEVAMKYQMLPLRSLRGSVSDDAAPQAAQGTAVHAIAGTGNPDTFFNALRAQGFRVLRHPFPDHHPFRREDIVFDDELPVIMTEKDAVKCLRIATDRHWYQPIEVDMPPAFGHRVLELLKKRRQHG
jgi:tetraacyldisaccharide 4'-kinase